MARDVSKIMPHSTLCTIICVILGIVILLCIFHYTKLSAGINMNVHLGSLNAGFNLENFEDNAGDDAPTIIMFHAPWCGHCKNAMPHFDKFKEEYKGPLVIRKVDCDANKDLAEKYGINGFPTIRCYPKGVIDLNNYITYDGARTTDGFMKFANEVAQGVVTKGSFGAAPIS